jgi:hypothetical protein
MADDWIMKFIRGVAFNAARRERQKVGAPDTNCATCAGSGWVGSPIEDGRGKMYLRCMCVWRTRSDKTMARDRRARRRS